MSRRMILTAISAGLCLSMALACNRKSPKEVAKAPSTPASGPTTGAGPKVQTADIDALKAKAPDQSHAMVSVAYHFNNLWFALQHENWPLAEFYLNESLSHMKWAVRIIPVRKDSAGREVKLVDILQSIENTQIKQMKDAIKAKDLSSCDRIYRQTLEACYACHKASDKPYLRPMIPKQPAETMINFEPKAEWPK